HRPADRDRVRRRGRPRSCPRDRRQAARQPRDRGLLHPPRGWRDGGGRLSMRIGVVTFPGSLDDGDAARAARIAGADVVRLWHGDPDLHGVDAVVLPGGFSYGDALRCGAIARFAPAMDSIIDAARGGLPVLGICNGFQILCEAHLLPGALTRNQHLHFRNRDQYLRVESTNTAWTNSFTGGQEILIPVKNGEGCYVAGERTLDQLEAEGRVVARYIRGNP